VSPTPTNDLQKSIKYCRCRLRLDWCWCG
jgi:hypothetical protein